MKLEIVLELERTTKNTARYKEIPPKGKPPVLGTLYIQQWALPTPYPEHISVAIEGPGE